MKRIKNKYIKTTFIILVGLLLTTSCTQKQDKRITIAVAANMQFAIKELSKKFTDRTGIKCDLIISSSGKLTAQIKEGAPFNIFISADMKYPTELFTTGFTTRDPKIYAYGKLVLWSMIDSLHPSINTLNSSNVYHIAIANPKTAPYGSAALTVLKKQDLYKSIKDKLVYGESISQTNQFIVSKSAQIGFTAKSVVLSPKMKNKGNWIDIDEDNYAAIAQGIVILNKHTTIQNGAEKFYNFMFSTEAKKILTDFGYSINNLEGTLNPL
ncbi:molybdate ABC transporter substrate-binding protein [Aquimarina longa]|uniref:molybdate ABC transporter substrate-binding protein n=1 Tax=Aquimarina longa TaxID=1080221 RepID=UPI000786752D|nr:molybdate ABC transporter substrate-binding protein [Aquimarina longa]